MLQQGLALAQREPPTLLAGDALTVLPQAVAAAPAEAALCVFHIATLAQFPPEARERFRVLISELARQRDCSGCRAKAWAWESAGRGSRM